MKRTLMVFCSLFLIAAGCSEENLEPGTFPLGVDFGLPVGETVSVDGINSKLNVKVENLYDSRCPANAICIWEGNYGADLVISDATQSTPVSLCNLFCGSSYTEQDTVSFILNENKYSAILKNITPYPGTTENNEPKEVVLKIIRQ